MSNRFWGNFVAWIKNFVIAAVAILLAWNFVLEERFGLWWEQRRQNEIVKEAIVGNKNIEELLILRKTEDNILGISCSAIDVKIKSNTKSDTDGGTKFHANVTATILADEGMFIWEKSLVSSSGGSRELKKEELRRLTFEHMKNNPLRFSVLRGASFSTWCEGKNITGTSSCTATANISGQQYPMACAKELLEAELRSSE